MAQKIGVLLLKVYREESENNVESVGITISTLRSRKKGGLNKKITPLFRLTRSNYIKM